MRVWIAQHGRALGGTLRLLLRAPWSTLFGVLVFGVVLALPLGLHVAVRAMGALGAQAAVEPRLVVYLDQQAGAADRAGIEHRLAAHPGIASRSLVTRDEALRELRARHGLGEIVDALPSNPLPDSWIVRARSTAPEDLEALRAEIAGWPTIAAVQVDGVWARRLQAARDLASAFAVALAGLLGVALVAVTFHAIRLQVLARQDEIEIAKLIGATDGYVRRPFLYAGTVQGLLGGGVAVGLVHAAVALANDRLAPLAALYQASFRVAAPGLPDGFALMGFAGLLGWVGAWLSVTGHLRRVAPR